MAHDQHDCDVYAGKRHVPSDDYHHHEDRGRVPRSEEKVASRQRKSCIHLRMWDFLGGCGANGNLACIILVIASKLRFNGSYSDELRSPHRLKSAGTPIKVVRYRDTHKETTPNGVVSLWCQRESRLHHPRNRVKTLF